MRKRERTPITNGENNAKWKQTLCSWIHLCVFVFSLFQPIHFFGANASVTHSRAYARNLFNATWHTRELIAVAIDWHTPTEWKNEHTKSADYENKMQHYCTVYVSVLKNLPICGTSYWRCPRIPRIINFVVKLFDGVGGWALAPLSIMSMWSVLLSVYSLKFPKSASPKLSMSSSPSKWAALDVRLLNCSRLWLDMEGLAIIIMTTTTRNSWIFLLTFVFGDNKETTEQCERNEREEMIVLRFRLGIKQTSHDNTIEM